MLVYFFFISLFLTGGGVPVDPPLRPIGLIPSGSHKIRFASVVWGGTKHSPSNFRKSKINEDKSGTNSFGGLPKEELKVRQSRNMVFKWN